MYFYILYNPTVVAHVHIIVYDTLGSVVPFMYQLYIYVCVCIYLFFFILRFSDRNSPTGNKVGFGDSYPYLNISSDAVVTSSRIFQITYAYSTESMYVIYAYMSE